MENAVRIIGIAEDGLRIETTCGLRTIPWQEVTSDHYLIKDKQSFYIGLHVGRHIVHKQAANDLTYD